MISIYHKQAFWYIKTIFGWRKHGPNKPSKSYLEKVKKALDEKNVKVEAAEITSVPKSTIKVVGEDAKKILSLVNELEDNDDVQNVYANFDIPDEVLKEMEE